MSVKEVTVCGKVFLTFVHLLCQCTALECIYWQHIGYRRRRCTLVDRLGQQQQGFTADCLHVFLIITHFTQVWSPIYRNHCSPDKALLMMLEPRRNKVYQEKFCALQPVLKKIPDPKLASANEYCTDRNVLMSFLSPHTYVWSNPCRANTAM